MSGETVERDRARGPADTPGRNLVILAIALLICWAAAARLDRSVLRDEAATSAPFAQFNLRVDLNVASEAELQLLPTIGPRLAQRIVEEREQNGRFDSLDDLNRVRGIGPTTIERILPYVVVVEP